MRRLTLRVPELSPQSRTASHSRRERVYDVIHFKNEEWRLPNHERR